ncbi:MAG: hypothetical protein A2039_00670 [Candidatus Melainabacteria bacterium GWA2_34_9]|nr:MAG: hypothetical protein A2039_00670 [Candidatus Melainabacteria bacterium GWA2_34_9]
MNISLTRNAIYKNVNFTGTQAQAPKQQNSSVVEKKHTSTPLVDNNYGRLLVSKKNISFKGLTVVPHPVEKKISSVLKYLQPDEMILVGENIDKASKLLKGSLDKVNNLVKRLFFIEEKGMDHTFAVMKDGSGTKQLINLGDRAIFKHGDLTDPNSVAKKGEKLYGQNHNVFQAGGAKFRLTDSPVETPDPINEIAREFNFSNKDSSVINRLNLKNIESLAENPEVTGGAKKITFADVGGQNDVIKELKEKIIYPIKYPEAYKKKNVTPGTILYGPPGTGKSLVAEALANEVDAHFIKMNGLELETKWVGETEKNWRSLFEEAKDKKPTIIFIDEFDAVAKKRAGSDTSRHDDKTVNQILTLMSDLEKSKEPVHVIVATNKFEQLDDAIVRSGRFGNHIEVKNPDLGGCKHILGIHSKGKSISEGFKADEFSEKLFKQKASGADISHIVNEAEDNCWKRANIFEKMEKGTFKPSDTDNLKIEHDDFEKALESFAKSRQKDDVPIKRPIGFRGRK